MPNPRIEIKPFKVRDLVNDYRGGQCIPLDESLWHINRREDFWKARRKLLAYAFNGFLRKMLPNRRI